MKGGFLKALIVLFLGTLAFASVRLSPPSYDFGLLTLDTTGSYTLELKNITFYPVHICGVNIQINDPIPVFSIGQNTCNGNTLNPDQTCTLQVFFKPREKKVYEATLTFLYDDDGNATRCDTSKELTATLRGAGTSLRVVRVSPEPIVSGTYFEFPTTPYGEVSRMRFRLCNAGGENILFPSESITLLVQDTGAFGISYNTCDNATLVYAQNNETCSVNFCEFEVIFDPRASLSIREIYRAIVRINDLNAGPASTPSGYTLYLSARMELPQENVINAPVGGQAQRIFSVEFICPDNGNDIPGETIPLLNTVSVNVSGAYFEVGNVSCPDACIEGQNVICSVAVVFRPQAPGIYEGQINIIFPDGTTLAETIVGVSGSLAGNYLLLTPSEITYDRVFPLTLSERAVEIVNTSGGQIPFDLYVSGNGFGISRTTCSCNEGYVYDGKLCVPPQDTPPVVARPYRLNPGERCTVFVYFFPPLGTPASEYTGELFVSTPVETYTVSLRALSSQSVSVPTPVSPPSVDLGGGGGGCSSSNYGFIALVPALLMLIRRLVLKYN